MSAHYATTPFGRRAMTLDLMASRIKAETAQEGTTVLKWAVLRHITEAKRQLTLPDRAIAVLHALLSFHQEAALTAGSDLIVFPSNRELALRANGMSIATLQRHLACLVDTGLILRKDSPNGKRYARRSAGGAIADAFGFDLTPLVARAEELEALAAETACQQRDLHLARERVTLLRRDIVKMLTLLATGGGAEVQNWQVWHAQFREAIVGLRRNCEASELQGIAATLHELAEPIRKALESLIIPENMRCNESHIEAHYQNQNTESKDLEPASKQASGGGADDPVTVEQRDSSQSGRAQELMPLGFVLEACPDIRDYGGNGSIGSWTEFIVAARLVRSLLGVSPDAWRDAVSAMGEGHASICIAALLQKGEAVRFPGGYLRALTKQARENALSVGQILMALVGTRRRAERGKSVRE